MDQHEAGAGVDGSIQGAEVRSHLRDLIVRGYTHLPGAVPRAQCDELIEAFTEYCQDSPESQEYADEHGHHSRLCNFHLESNIALAVGLNPRVLDVLDAAFSKPAAICSSLLFEKGSEQPIHRDALFFHTAPANQFFGVWTALEDVAPDSGPLAYFVGAHRLPIDRLEIAEVMQGRTSGEMFNEYIARLHAACREGQFPFAHADFMQKGDVLIWHPQLPHGGSPIAHAGRTRRSVVFHYVPEGCSVHGVDAF
ncbi:MAG TPA: phytanoyl-CoA dioxygenase family protein, partial [Nocardioides sp.]|nr:phytanoyl-CoA dioxygenase family protein [Nocardioides sp.]